MKYASKIVAKTNPTIATAQGFCSKDIKNHTIGSVIMLPRRTQSSIFLGFLATNKKMKAMRVSEISVIMSARINDLIRSCFRIDVVSFIVAVPSLSRLTSYELLKFFLEISFVMKEVSWLGR